MRSPASALPPVLSNQFTPIPQRFRLLTQSTPVTISTHSPSPFLPAFVRKQIGEFEIVDDHRAGKIVIELVGRVNKCGVVSPRFDVKGKDMEKWIANLLPSRLFGRIVLTTSYGIMDHEEAKRKKTGGKILGFFY